MRRLWLLIPVIVLAAVALVLLTIPTALARAPTMDNAATLTAVAPSSDLNITSATARQSNTTPTIEITASTAKLAAAVNATPMLLGPAVATSDSGLTSLARNQTETLLAAGRYQIEVFAKNYPNPFNGPNAMMMALNAADDNFGATARSAPNTLVASADTGASQKGQPVLDTGEISGATMAIAC